MSFGIDDNYDEIMSEINMTPLVDVMLVLLIIFIITVPVINHAVNLNLPQANNQINTPTPQAVQISVDANGQVSWNNTSVNEQELASSIQKAAQQNPSPDVQLRADKAVRYEKVAQVLAAIQRGGLHKVGFVTDPAP